MAKRTIRAIAFMLMAIILFVCVLPFVFLTFNGEASAHKAPEYRNTQEVIESVKPQEVLIKTTGRPDSKS